MLNVLTPLQNAVFEYQGVCDGLVWSDEIPSMQLNDQQEQVVRYLIQYRTSLICEEPIQFLETLWKQAVAQFPNWAGFAMERSAPSKHLCAVVNDARYKLARMLDEDIGLS